VEILPQGGIHAADGLAELSRTFAPLKVYADFGLRPPYVAMKYRLIAKDKLEVTYLVPDLARGAGAPGENRAGTKETFTLSVTDRELVLTTTAGKKTTLRRAGLAGFGRLVNTLKHGRPGCAAFSPDGKTLAVGGSLPSQVVDRLPEATVHLWDVASGKEKATWWQNTRKDPARDKFAQPNQVEHVAFCLGGTVLAAHDTLGGTTFWDVGTGKQLFAIKERDVVLAPDGKSFAAPPAVQDGNNPKAIPLRDAGTGRELARLPWDHPEKVTAVAFAPAGDRLAALGERGNLVIWDLATRRPLPKLAPDKPAVGLPPPFQASALTFAPDGQLLAVLDQGTVQIWDLAPRTLAYRDDAPPQPDALLFGPGGRSLLVRSRSTTPTIYTLDRRGRKLVAQKSREAPRSPGATYPLLFSTDGAALFARPQNAPGVSKLQLWQTRTWKQQTRFLGRQVAQSPDGRLVAVVGGSEYDVVDLWRISRKLGE
jgi:WD40 repeat protein